MIVTKQEMEALFSPYQLRTMQGGKRCPRPGLIFQLALQKLQKGKITQEQYNEILIDLGYAPKPRQDNTKATPASPSPRITAISEI